MKFFVALALAAVAVSAADYSSGVSSSSSSSFYYMQPELPCAYTLEITRRDYNYGTSYSTIKTDGRFTYKRVPASYYSSSYITTVTRPDIFKLVDGQKKAGRATIDRYYDCDLEYVNIDEAVENMSTFVKSYFDGFNNRTYVHKEPVTINEKECDVYYDEDVDVEAMYVCDEFIYRIYNYSYYYDYFNITFNFTWGEPEMEDFAITSSQYGCDSRVENTPSRKYAHCSLTSSSSGSLGSYTYLQPGYPCAFELQITSSDSITKYFKFDGNFIYRAESSRYGDTTVGVTRPDIRRVENGTEEMAVFTAMDSGYACSMTYYPIKTLVDSMHSMVWSLTDGFNNRTYYHKEHVIINKKHYDLYYDEEKEDEVVYVHRGYIYKVQVGNSFVNFDYTWFQPQTSEFALSRSQYSACASQDQRIFSTPSRDYANCVVPAPPSVGSLDSSVRTEAMLFAVIAVIATSLVALF